MKIDSLPEILSSSDFDPVNDKILVEQNGKTFYTTLFDIQSILNTRARPSEKTSWKFVNKDNVIESPISKISLANNFAISAGQPELASSGDPLNVENTEYFNIKIADLESGVPTGVRRVLVKLIAESLTIKINWRSSCNFFLDVPAEKHVSIFPMENIQNSPIKDQVTPWLYNSKKPPAGAVSKVPGDYQKYIAGHSAEQSDKLPYKLQSWGSHLASNAANMGTFANNSCFYFDPDRNKEIGPLTMSGLTPSGPESLNLDSIDNISVSLSPFPSNNIGKIYSFQVIAYSNFG